MPLSTDAWLLALRLCDGAQVRALADPRRIPEAMRGAVCIHGFLYLMDTGIHEILAERHAAMHPMELVIQVVARV